MNRKLKRTLVILLTIVALLLAAAPSFAQTNPISATVDRHELSTDESLVLTITVQGIGGNVSEPEIPYLDGLNIVGSSTSSQISIVNGKSSSSKVYQYRLQPARPGEVTIAPIQVTVDGQIYKTEPISVKISQGTGAATAPGLGQAAPAAAPEHTTEISTELNGQDLFVEAVVDNPTPYQGEAIEYVFRFYQAINLFRDPNYQPPSFTGFWTDNEPYQTDYTVEAAGRTYRVSEVHHTLAPTANGDVVIEPTLLNIPGSLFDAGQSLQTRPVAVSVQPWPQGAPADFKGAVGKFSISAKVDTAETKVNEPVTLEVIVSGEGNVDTAGDPVWTEGSEWRTFEQQATTSSSKQDGKITGQKVYERLLIPTRAGDLTIPAISYSYFDPETAVYHTTSTEPMTIKVTAEDSTTAVPDPNNTPPQPTTTLNIRPLKTAPGQSAAATPLTARPWFWLLWLVPLALVAGQAVYQRRQRYWDTHGDEVRRKKAAGNARRTLQNAAQTNVDGYQAAAGALTQYLADKLGHSVTGLSRTELAQRLAQHGLETTLIDEVSQFLAWCENGRYAPGGSDTDKHDILTRAQTLIGKLEQQF